VIFWGIINFCVYIERKLLPDSGEPMVGSAEHTSESSKQCWLPRYYLWILRNFRNAIYHPWAILMETDMDFELPMADVLTTEGSLYSGLLYYWAPKDNNLASITLTNVIRYYAAKKILNDEHVSKQQGPAPSTTKPEKPKKVGVIPNHGSLTVPFEKIETVHFWKIKKGSAVTIRLRTKDDVEKLKWYLLLIFRKKGFFTKLNLEMALDQATDTWFRADFKEWITKNKLKFEKGTIEIRHISPNP
jgi:hypothetical protein